MATTITIHLNGSDVDLKRMLGELAKSRHGDNPYVGRSESEIAKMLLREPLEKKHKRFCPKNA